MTTTSNLPQVAQTSDTEEVRSFFDKYYQTEMVFPSNQVDAVVGFFLKRGFDTAAANSTAIILLIQARIDNVNPFVLLDTLKGLTETQLSQMVTEVMNLNREKTSALGYNNNNTTESIESRNIRY